MSQHHADTHSPGHGRDPEHGTVRSYIIGFILSLVFTFIPYLMVVNKTVSGTALLATIIGFAIVQMIIQVTFFLHLGRGPKPNWNMFFFVATVCAIIFIVGGSILIMEHLHYNMSPADTSKKLISGEGIYQIGGEKTGACQGVHDNHKVIIKNGVVSPTHTIAKKCDSITILNDDEGVREIAFGPHPNHDVYAGEKDLVVRKGRGKSFTLSETGTYQFHDHLKAETAGFFTVNP
jgi:cytochrome o ubiquinol oxidase subunit IV